MIYLTLNTAVEVSCLIVALAVLLRVKQPHWRGMAVFMLLICVAEFSGIYLKYSTPGIFTRNEWIYNFLLLFQIGFISWMFYYMLKPYLQMTWIIALEAIILSILYSYEIWEHGIIYYNQLTNTVMVVIISLFSLLYYYFLIRATNYVNLARYADFWWVTGIFFFSFGTTACNVFYHHLAPHANDTIKRLTYYIYGAFNPILYGCWSYSFICKKWETRTTQA